MAIAEKIINALAKDDLEPWIDWKSIPKGETFEREIQQGIEEADVFLFLVSPDSVQSEWCNKEIDHAVENGKRILPIIIRDTDPKIIHPEISKRNWIFCRDGLDDFNKAIAITRETIHADYEWLKFHTRLQVRALELERTSDSSRLLRGKELREAEQQILAIEIQKEPQPTEAQRNYFLASRINEAHTRRMIISGLTAGLIIVLIVAALALWQWQRAEHEANIALSRQLPAIAMDQAYDNPDLALLLSIEAVKRDESFLAKDSLFRLLQINHSLIRYYQGHKSPISAMQLSSKERYLAVGYQDGVIRVWNMVTSKEVGDPFGRGSGEIREILFDSQEITLISGERGGGVRIWDLEAEQEVISREIINQGALKSMAISPIGDALAIGAGDVKVFSLPELKEFASFQSGGDANGLVFSDDGAYLFAGSNDGGIHQWDLVNGRETILRSDYNPKITALTYEGRQGLLSSMDVQGTLRLWDVITGQLMWEVHTTAKDKNAIDFGPMGGSVLCGGTDGLVTIWDVGTGLQIGDSLPMVGRAITALVYFENAQQIAIAANDGSIKLINLDSKSNIGSQIEAPSSITGIEFSPDGKTLISAGSYDINFWSVNSGKELDDPITEASNIVFGIAFSPDGRKLATGGNWDQIYLWDADSHQLETILKGHGHMVMDLIYDSSGTFLFSGSYDGTLRQWDLSPGNMTNQILAENLGRIESIDVDPSGNFLVAGSDQGVFLLQVNGNDVNSNKHIREIGNADLVLDVAFSPNGNLLASSDAYGNIRFWDPSSEKLIGRNLLGHLGGVNSIDFSPDGRTLVSGGKDGTLRLWDADSGLQIGSPLGLGLGDVRKVKFSPDGTFIASSSGSLIRFWDVQTWHPKISHAIDGAGKILNLAYNIEANIIASGGTDNKVRIWDLGADGKPIKELATDWDVSSLTTVQKNDLLISGGCAETILESVSCKKGKIQFWSIKDGTLLSSMLVHENYVADLALTPNETILASRACLDHDGGCTRSEILFWDMESREMIGTPLIIRNTTVGKMKFNASGSMLAIGQGDGTIQLWNYREGKSEDPLVGHSALVADLAFTSTRNKLVSISWDNTIIVWDLATENALNILNSNMEHPSRVAISPDGKLLAVGDNNGNIGLWDLEIGQPIGNLIDFASSDIINKGFFIDSGHPSSYGHLSAITGLFFSNDGNILISSAADSTVRAWDISLNSWTAKACHQAGRNLTTIEWIFYFPGEKYKMTCPEWGEP